MDISIINFLLLAFVIILLILVIFRIKSNQSGMDEESIVDKISLNLSQNQSAEIAKVLNLLTQSGQSQSEVMSKNLQNLEQRFGEVQLKLSQDLGDNMEKVQNNLLKRIQEGLDVLAKNNNDKLSEIQGEVAKRLDENFAKNLKAFGEVRENLGQMQNTAQRMIDSTKSVDKLNSIFERTASKSFGDFGEKYLESLLRENLSENSWKSQVGVPGSAEKIDFVIEVDGKKIGIDSKFPVTKYRDFIDADMENKERARKEFLRQVMDMAKSINEKYGKANFLDVLLIYLPSDSMYTDVVNDQKVSEYLAKVKVSPTSPNTIFPLIKTLSLYQMKSQISNNAERIISGLQIVKKSMDAFQDEFRKLGDKLRTAQDNYDKAGRSLNVFEKEVIQLETMESKESLTTSEKQTNLL